MLEKETKIFQVLQKFKEYAEEQGLIVYAVALKGSQNYNLDDEESDIDANLVFIPTLQQLRSNEKFKYVLEEGEITCHNIYSFADIVAKGNPQWIEVCQTEYVIGDLSMFKHYKLNPSALKGMMMEKVTAFSKLYPSRAKYVEKYGYDPKQLHHIIRLYDVLKNDDSLFKYYGEERDELVGIKRGSLNLEEAKELMNLYIDKTNEIYEERKLQYVPQEVDYNIIDEIVMSYLRK